MKPSHPEPDQPLSAFCPLGFHKFEVLWNHFRRADRTMVFFRPANGAAHCRRAPDHVPDFSHHQRQSSFLNYLTIIPFLACLMTVFLGIFCRDQS